MKKYPGALFIITAPSGAGKSSLIKSLLEYDSSILLSISCTTRPPRLGEKDGREYHYLSINNFKEMIRKKALLEWAKVHDHFYGTPRNFIDYAMRNGKDIILEIDWQGTRQIKKHYPKAFTIFVLPPSIKELENRLITRNKDSSSTIKNRISEAKIEISHIHEFEYVIINENFNSALLEFIHIINASRLQLNSQIARNNYIFKQLGI